MESPMVERQQTALSALNTMVATSGLSAKQICAHLDMDPGQWSRILAGQAHFPLNKLCDLFDVCGSELLLQWLLYSRGYEAKPIKRKSRLELELDAALKRAEQAELENKILAKALRGAGHV